MSILFFVFVEFFFVLVDNTLKGGVKMVENKQVMATNIIRYMEQNNVKATDICKALGIKHNTFSDWVNGKTYPRIDKIEMMANYFGVSKACLVEDASNVDYAISDDEMNLIIEFRKSDLETQKMVRRLLAYAEGFKEMKKNDH